MLNTIASIREAMEETGCTTSQQLAVIHEFNRDVYRRYISGLLRIEEANKCYDYLVDWILDC